MGSQGRQERKGDKKIRMYGTGERLPDYYEPTEENVRFLLRRLVELEKITFGRKSDDPEMFFRLVCKRILPEHVQTARPIFDRLYPNRYEFMDEDLKYNE